MSLGIRFFVPANDAFEVAYLRSMRVNWVAVIFSIFLIIACFLPWVIIENKNITVKGIEAGGTAFGKPGYMHFFLTTVYISLVILNKWWSKRIAIFIAAFNMAWAVRNFIIISACHGGECPVKKIGIYIMVASSFAMLIAILLTPVASRKI
jgi:hypothetical protein